MEVAPAPLVPLPLWAQQGHRRLPLHDLNCVSWEQGPGLSCPWKHGYLQDFSHGWCEPPETEREGGEKQPQTLEWCSTSSWEPESGTKSAEPRGGPAHLHLIKVQPKVIFSCMEINEPLCKSEEHKDYIHYTVLALHYGYFITHN